MNDFENGTSAFGASRGKSHPLLALYEEMVDCTLKKYQELMPFKQPSEVPDRRAKNRCAFHPTRL